MDPARSVSPPVVLVLDLLVLAPPDRAPRAPLDRGADGPPAESAGVFLHALALAPGSGAGPASIRLGPGGPS